MTPPDLAALRALVEAGQLWLDEIQDNLQAERFNAENRARGGALGPSVPPRWQARERLKALLPAAQAALEPVELRLNALELAARYGTPFDPTGAKTGMEMQGLRARLARLEEALHAAERLLDNINRPMSWDAWYAARDAALEGRDE